MKECPSCLISLEGELIIETFRKQKPDAPENEIYRMFSNYAPIGTPRERLEELSKTKRWGLEIGLEMGDYDGVSLWYCPFCKHVWKRSEDVSDAILKDGIEIVRHHT